MKRWKSVLGVIAIIAVLAILYLAAAMYIDNVEHPDYQILISDGDIEVRNYDSIIVAEISGRGERREAVSQAFSPLASYIFAKERSGDKIAMTAPVTQVRRETIAMTAPITQSPVGNLDNEWAVRFIMPSKYTLTTLPEPQNESIKLIEVEGRKRVVIRFSGLATDALVADKERQLLAWIKARGMRISSAAPTYAYYNSPFTPGFLRRNEVMFDLQAE